MNNLALSELRIRHYRGLEDLTLSGLGRVNLLVGANNTGKTSVMEAVHLLARAGSVIRLLEVGEGRSENGTGEGRLEAIRWAFGARDIRRPIHLGATVACADRSEELELEVSAVPIEIRRPTVTVPAIRLDLSVAFSGKELFKAQQTITPDNELQEEKSARTPFPSELLSPVAHRARSLHADYGRCATAGELPAVVELLQQFDRSITGVQDIEVEGTRSFYMSLEGGRSQPLNVFGDGLRRALVYGLALPSCRDGVLLIDEIETALHPTALAGVYRWLLAAAERLNVQIIATTHSIEAVDAILDDRQSTSDDKAEEPHGELESLRIFQLIRGEPPRRLSGTQAWRMRHHHGWELR